MFCRVFKNSTPNRVESGGGGKFACNFLYQDTPVDSLKFLLCIDFDMYIDNLVIFEDVDNQ